MKANRMKKFIALGLALALTGGVMTACGSSNSSGDSSSKTKVVIAGSTSMQPLSEALAKQYMKDNSNVSVEVQGGGSGQGIKSIEDNIADIGSLSRDVDDSEKSSVDKVYTIAKDGVAVVVNTETTGVSDITLDELKDVFTGKITNWKDLGGKDADITVVSREEGSGTREAFTTITGVLVKDSSGNETDNTTSDALVQSSTGAVLKTVKSTPDSIGYISLGSLTDSVKALKVDGVSPSEDTVLDGSYEISRPLIYVTGDSTSKAAKAFIKYALSDAGQKIVEKSGFIPVN